MTVEELIEKLNEYPKDMPIGINYDISSDVEVNSSIWTHNNYPYDKPDIEFINLA